MLKEKLTPKTYKVFQYELAVNLATDWHVCNWRLRRVERIKTLDQETYHQKTSFQFVIPPERVFKAIRLLLSQSFLNETERAYLSNLKESDLSNIEIPIIVPLDRFPKRILLGFSLQDSTGKPIVFLTRYDSSKLGYLILRAFLKTVQKHEGKDKAASEIKALKGFIDSPIKVFTSLVFMADKDLKKECERFHLGSNFKNDFSSITEELEKYKEIFMHQIQMAEAEFFPIWSRIGSDIREILISVSNIQTICRDQAGIRDWDGINPATNPLILVGDYFLLNEHLNSQDKFTPIKSFIDEVKIYTFKLEEFCKIASPEVLKAVLGMLNVAASSYLGFFEIIVNVDKPFIIKYEQVLSAGKRRFGGIGYGINLGFERSWHLEVICPSTMEVQYQPQKSYIELEGIKGEFRPEEIIGSEIGTSKDRYHYYKNRTWLDIDKYLIARGSLPSLKEGLRPTVTLWAKFKLDWLLLWSHWLGFGIVLFWALMFFYLFDYRNPLQIFEGGGQGKRDPILWITLVGPLVVFFMAVREKESITVELLGNLKKGIIWIVGIMYGWVIVSILLSFLSPL